MISASRRAIRAVTDSLRATCSPRRPPSRRAAQRAARPASGALETMQAPARAAAKRAGRVGKMRGEGCRGGEGRRAPRGWRVGNLPPARLPLSPLYAATMLGNMRSEGRDHWAGQARGRCRRRKKLRPDSPARADSVRKPQTRPGACAGLAIGEVGGEGGWGEAGLEVRLEVADLVRPVRAQHVEHLGPLLRHPLRLRRLPLQLHRRLERRRRVARRLLRRQLRLRAPGPRQVSRGAGREPTDGTNAARPARAGRELTLFSLCAGAGWARAGRGGTC